MSDIRKLADIAESLDDQAASDVFSDDLQSADDSNRASLPGYSEDGEADEPEEKEESAPDPEISVETLESIQSPEPQIESHSDIPIVTSNVEDMGEGESIAPSVERTDELPSATTDVEQIPNVDEPRIDVERGVENAPVEFDAESHIQEQYESPQISTDSVPDNIDGNVGHVDDLEDIESPSLTVNDILLQEAMSIEDPERNDTSDPVIQEASPDTREDVYPQTEGESAVEYPQISVDSTTDVPSVAPDVDVIDEQQSPDVSTESHPDIPDTSTSVGEYESPQSDTGFSFQPLHSPETPAFSPQSMELPDTGGFGRSIQPMFAVNVTMGAEEDFVKQLTEQLSPQLQEQQYILTELVRQQFDLNNTTLTLMGDD